MLSRAVGGLAGAIADGAGDAAAVEMATRVRCRGCRRRDAEGAEGMLEAMEHFAHDAFEAVESIVEPIKEMVEDLME